MGECGCSSTDVTYRLPGPPGVHYGIEIYPSCNYCFTPVGLVVHRFDDENAEMWMSGIAEPDFQGYEGVEEVLLPIIDAEHLAAALGEWREEDDERTLRRLASEFHQVLSDAVWRTADAWHRMVSDKEQQ
jgi:hypothetical protein